MAIIPEIGRKSWKIRLLIWGIYLFLLAGSATMIYPMMLMVAGSISSQLDLDDFRPIPRYLHSQLWQRAKYLAEKYGYWSVAFQSVQSRYGGIRYHEKVCPRCGEYNTQPLQDPILRCADCDLDLGDVAARDFVPLHYKELLWLPTRGWTRYPEPQPENGFPPERDPRFRRQVEEWEDFKMRVLPAEMRWAGFSNRWLCGETQERYQAFLRERFEGDIQSLNAAFENKTAYEQFNEIDVPEMALRDHLDRPITGPQTALWSEFRETLPSRFFITANAEEQYHQFLLRRYDAVEKLNAAWGTAYASVFEIRFPLSVPGESEPRAAWEEFLRMKYPLWLLQPKSGADAWPGFLRERYESIEGLNEAYGTAFASFEDAPFPERLPVTDREARDWAVYVDTKVPITDLVIDTTRARYQRFLREKHPTIADVNEAYGTGYQSFEEIMAPIAEEEYLDFMDRRWEIVRDFLFGNYRRVFAFIALNGRALINTIVLVTATMATQLTVMPLAAFALSRFRTSYTHRVLLFFLATMAFPGEVAMIPNFLLLKEFHLLNTYWALVLPGVASGFSIFLLKGFFDSLPAELYETATIEGASELYMFRHITLPLSKPVMAVIALGSFGAAYGGFMWAFLICQKQEMWTLMVFLYQFQQDRPQSIIMASLVVAAIPTLLVFIFCQKIILRGIIIPTMK
jgi:ABC-type glycerol-3-phosphate transport system permease component